MSYLNQPDAALFLRRVLSDRLAASSSVIFAPAILEHLRDVHEVQIFPDDQLRFEMTQNTIIDIFGGRMVRETPTAYLTRLRENGQALELDMLIALALQYGVGVQVYQPFQQKIFPLGGLPRMSDELYQLIFLIPPQSPRNASLIFLYTPARLPGMIGHYEPMVFLSESVIRNKMTALRRREKKREMELCDGRVDADRLTKHLLNIKPEDMKVPSVLRKDKDLYLADLKRKNRLPSPPRVIVLPYEDPDPKPAVVDLVCQDEDAAFLRMIDDIESAYFRLLVPVASDANGEAEEQEDGSDVDSSGNLAGFVCSDSVGNSEADTQSSSESSSGSSLDSGRSGLSFQSKERRRLKKELGILQESAQSCLPQQLRRRDTPKRRGRKLSSPAAPKKQKVTVRRRLMEASSSSEDSQAEASGLGIGGEAVDRLVPALHAGLVQLQDLLRSIQADMVLFKHELERSVLSSPGAASAALTVSVVASPSSPAAGLQELASPNMFQAEFTQGAIVWQQEPSPALLVEELTSEDTDIFEARVLARRAANLVQQFPRRRSNRQRRAASRVDV